MVDGRGVVGNCDAFVMIGSGDPMFAIFICS